MKATSLMYHDVVEEGDPDSSGFPGGAAALYKLPRAAFERHLKAIAAAGGYPQAAAAGGWDSGQPLFLTFDDGGVSASTVIAPLLEKYQWRGHFFMTTNCIGRPGFLTADQLRNLARQGHVIGTHSTSHPTVMSSLTRSELLAEWSSSRARLEDILGARVEAASVPGGYYSAAVGETAAEAGIRMLFYSQPTVQAHRVAGCWVLGRYYLQRHMSAETAAGLAVSRWAPRFRQALLWNCKKAAKSVAGGAYLKLWRTLLER
jgi:peptidoglycan/xylan/chitin deacetylase (PgdA/CDA1 family)